jgi:phosphoglycolate phosphatase-like HAD superfamily hydrolase
MSKLDTILFDLDGTLIDSIRLNRPGIAGGSNG